ncbi:hypothetical protein SKAU_G00365290 [Synaphobranchus kaupii]|uniref:Putative monooxygenase p33MONOX n=1 Tax=Synaphobranchus kaupii TaxID=118154 RepID=A0A9Q1EEZ3_SYNKA|nr:hypothetical protein SKAU_G00365290 [Synaphobranchus kaupii]
MSRETCDRCTHSRHLTGHSATHCPSQVYLATQQCSVIQSQPPPLLRTNFIERRCWDNFSLSHSGPSSSSSSTGPSSSSSSTGPSSSLSSSLSLPDWFPGTMASRQGDIPALESGNSGGPMGEMAQPIGMARRALSYDDSLEMPMVSPPPDITFNILWKRPVIPEKKSRCLSEGDDCDTPITFEAPPTKPTVPVVKAKASSFILNSLMIKQTQDNIQRFEQQAGLTDAGYTPHKGLTAEETRYHCMAEALHATGQAGRALYLSESANQDAPVGQRCTGSYQRLGCKQENNKNGHQGSIKRGRKRKTHSYEKKLKMPSGGLQGGSPENVRAVHPQRHPQPNRRSWFGQSSVAFFPISQLDGGETRTGHGRDRGRRRGQLESLQHAIHSVKNPPLTQRAWLSSVPMGNQKTNTLEMMKTRVTQEPILLKTPKIEIPGLEVKKHMPPPPQTQTP